MQLHQQKGMISLSPPTICNSATVCLIEIFIYKIPTRNITIIVAESIFVLLIPCHIYVSEFISLMRGSRSNDVKNHAKRLIHCLY
ncbi:hypothetical protein AC96_5076 [Escherichia coli 2-156-04_S4_C2]|nr:hypothetical protein AC96_5076 [Escherichia coli 2-156-04_S4_C2]